MQFPARLLAALLTAICPLLQAEDYTPGESYYGRNNYIEYIAGDLPLILTAGHGGSRTPSEIPIRTVGTHTTDANTRELTLAIADEIHARTGRHAHVIISHLARSRLDPNREIVEAAQGNVHARQAWHEFHGFIAGARRQAEADFGFGLVVDFHGHGHSVARLEMGYLLGNAQLNLDDAELARPGYLWRSSLRTLALSHPGKSLVDLVRGPRSLGELLTARGKPAWPSATYPVLGDAEFFSGGYITATHSCLHDNGVVHGLQIECNRAGIRDTASNRAAFATAFAHAIQPYLWDNYGYDIGTLSLSRIVPPALPFLSRGGAPLTVTVRRTGHLGLGSTLNLAFGGTAVAGEDYAVSPARLTFAANVDTASFTLVPAAAGGAAGDRTIEISLAPSDTQSADLTPLVVTLDDGVNSIVRIASGVPALSESAGAGFFRVTRTRASGALSVPVSWSGTAGHGSDYVPGAGAAVFADGESGTTVPFLIVDDGVVERDKTIELRLNDGPGYVVGHAASAIVTITDDDGDSDLVAWYPGDISGNRLLDASGAGHHATTLPAGRGPIGSGADGASFAVFGGAEDTAALPRLTLDSEAGFTLAFRFRIEPSAAATGQNLASYGARGDAGTLNVHLSSASTLRTSVNSADGDLSPSDLDVPGDWLDGAWRHYAVTLSAGGARTVYIDGLPACTAGGWSGRLSAGERLWLGWKPENDASAAFLKGGLADVRVYSRPLGAEEIAALASGRLSFAAWREHWRLPASIEPADDPFGSGHPLLLDYAFGRRPGETRPLHAFGMADDRLAVDFRRQTAASDVSWSVEASSDPVSGWEALARFPAGAAAWLAEAGVGLSESDGLVSVSDRESTAGTPRRFLRIRVAQ